MNGHPMDAIIVAVDFRGVEDLSPSWSEGTALHLDTGLKARLGEDFREPSRPAPMPADCPTPFAAALAELDGRAARLQAEGSERTADSVRYRFPVAAWRSALRLALDALTLNQAGWSADTCRRHVMGVGIAVGGADASGGPAWTMARRLAVLAPPAGLLASASAAVLLRDAQLDLAPVADGAWQVLWARRGGALEKRRALRVECEQPAMLRTGGRALAAHTRNVSSGGACVVLHEGEGVSDGAAVELDLGSFDARLRHVSGRVVESGRDRDGKRVARVAFEDLDDLTRGMLVARLFGAPPPPAAPTSPVEQPRQDSTPSGVAEAFEALASARTVEEVCKTVVMCADGVVGLDLPSFQVDRDTEPFEDGRIQVVPLLRGHQPQWLVRTAGRFTAILHGRARREPPVGMERWLRSLLVCAGSAIARLLDGERDHVRSGREARARTADRLLAAQRAAAIGPAWAMTAHALNNALTPLMASSELLADRDDVPAEVRAELSRFSAACEQVADEVARLQAWQRKRLDRQVVDVHRVLLDVVALWRPRLDAEGIALEVELEAGTPRLEADPLQVAVVFHQLIDNGRRAVQRAGGRGRVRVRSFEVEGVPCIQVEDDGCGMPPGLERSAFDPYVTDSPEEGAGLGLSLCRYVLERVGAGIEVSETGPEGTSIRVTLAGRAASAESASLTASAGRQ